MEISSACSVLDTKAIVDQLRDPESYPHSVDGPIAVLETHISWILLAGNFAYKIKKRLKNNFLDYSTLEQRHHACCEEVRLGWRYAEGLYLDVVPITCEDGMVRMDGDAYPVEFAVRMRRFPSDALLSVQLRKGNVSESNINQLARTLSEFHQRATVIAATDGITADATLEQALENFDALRGTDNQGITSKLPEIESWVKQFFSDNQQRFKSRIDGGFVRECHGDLHCDNIVYWRNHWTPYDGIEFNKDYTRIDTISDIAFLIMDLTERSHASLAIVLLNAYLEHTGDYEGLLLLRWYMVYRAMVRAKVAFIRSQQLTDPNEMQSQLRLAEQYLTTAITTIHSGERSLWITHGVSGSGKTTGSQKIVVDNGAIRIRSDVERKRLFGMLASSVSTSNYGQGIYSSSASEMTYGRLRQLSRTILEAGYPVVVDATFLKRADRDAFHALAEELSIRFQIVDFYASESILHDRINRRRLANNDASDATIKILEKQLATQEPLAPAEQAFTITGNAEYGNR